MADDKSRYIWSKSSEDARSMSRDLTHSEQMFAILNRDFHGQNCAFMGASISLQGVNLSGQSRARFDVQELQRRAEQAFVQTRWRYPTVAARVSDDGTRTTYPIETREDVETWAARTVAVVRDDGGWLKLRNRLSDTATLPSPSRDCCLFYLVVRPYEAERGELTAFDVLMHVHHSLVDGSGIRSILNEFLTRLASPLMAAEDLSWGDEIARLLPASYALLEAEEEEPTLPPKDVKSDGDKTVIGLPLYRPDIGPADVKNRGTRLVSHTWNVEFLPMLLAASRKRGVKLASVLEAALFQAVHEATESHPGPKDVYSNMPGFDLRNGWMMPLYSAKNAYVNLAVAITPTEVPCHLFDDQADGFWKAAAHIHESLAATRQNQRLGVLGQRFAAGFVASSKKPTSAPPAKPQTYLYFVSDPPGSMQLDSSFPVSGFDDLHLTLASYQLATDQNRATVSARSHSFLDKLTVTLAFNHARNPVEEMQRLLARWTRILEAIGADQTGGE